MEKIDLKSWPHLWPSPDLFLGSVVADIASLHYIPAMMEHQVIIRFKNNYGVKISQISIHQGLYSVSILRFYGSHFKKYRLVKNSFIPQIFLFFSKNEILAMCEEVAQWENKPIRS